MKKKIILLLFLSFLLYGCSSSKENPIITMDIENYGTIKMELYPNIAPNTVANFVNLTEEGFYDNNTIHRVQKKFVVQGGDPTGTGIGGPGYTIKGEFNANGFKNNLSHTEGIVSMARTAQSYDSAGSQFFIILSDYYTASLDGQYAAFGKVIEGMDIIHNIENDNLEYTDEAMGMLKNNIIINKTTVDTKGENYTVQKMKK